MLAPGLNCYCLVQFFMAMRICCFSLHEVKAGCSVQPWKTLSCAVSFLANFLCLLTVVLISYMKRMAEKQGQTNPLLVESIVSSPSGFLKHCET